MVRKKVAGEQSLALQKHFPYKSSKFYEKSYCRLNVLFNAKSLTLGYSGIFDALFLFLASFKL